MNQLFVIDGVDCNRTVFQTDPLSRVDFGEELTVRRDVHNRLCTGSLVSLDTFAVKVQKDC